MRRVINRIMAVFALCSLCSTTFALTSVRVALDWYINPDHAPLLVAQQKGFFKQHGLDVKLLPPVSSSGIYQLVAAGKVDFAIDYESYLLKQIDAGMPLVWTATLVAQPLNTLTVLQSSGITSIGQLKGKRIGTDASASEEVTLKTILKSAGLTMHDVNVVNVNMGLTQALLSRRVDAVVGTMRNVEPVQLHMMGVKTFSFYPEQYGVPPYDELIIVANKHRLQPKIVKAFNAALQQGVDDLRRHPHTDWYLVSKAYASILAANSNMARVNYAIWQATVPYFTHDVTGFDIVKYQRFKGFMVKSGLLKKSVPCREYVWSGAVGLCKH